IPTLEDVAESIYDEQPTSEKRKLQEVFKSQYESMHESTLSDDGQDEYPGGTGTPLSVPDFIANYLKTFAKGLADRFELSVRGIDVQLDVDLPPEHPSDNASPISSATSINLHFDELGLEKASTGSATGHHSPETSKGLKVLKRPGKRQVYLHNFSAQLISDASLFATLSRTSSIASPVETHSSGSSSQRPRSEGSASRRSSRIHRSALHESKSSSGSEVYSDAADQSPPSPLALKASKASIATDDGDRFADAGDDEGENQDFSHPNEILQHSTLSERELYSSRDSILSDSNYLDYAIQNGLFESTLGDQNFSSSHQSVSMQDSSTLGVERLRQDHNMQESISGSQQLPVADSPAAGSPRSHSQSPEPITSLSKSDEHILLHTDPRLQEAGTDNMVQALEVTRVPSNESSNASDETPSPISAEDLSESRIFSHEEAESMYMSAMTDVQSVESTPRLNIPGGWDSSSEKSDNSDHQNDNLHAQTLSIGASMKLTGAIEHGDGIETPRARSRATSDAPSSASSLPTVNKAHLLNTENTSPSLASKISKQLISGDKVSVWVPDHFWTGYLKKDQPTEDAENPDERSSQSPSMEDSILLDSSHQSTLGSFSQYAQVGSTGHRRWNSNDSKPSSRKLPSKSSPQGDTSSPVAPTEGIEVDIGAIRGYSDISAGRIVMQIVQQIQCAFTSSGSAPVEKTPESDQTGGGPMISDINISYICFALLEQLRGYGLAVNQDPVPQDVDLTDDILLRTDLKGIRIRPQLDSDNIVVRADVRRFTFGLKDENILSFDDTMNGSKSGRPESERGNDIAFVYKLSQGIQKVKLLSSPVKIDFDAQKLDETLSCFGGFSGILELSSSITSTSTVLPKEVKPQPRPRGVHFVMSPNEKPVDAQPGVSIKAEIGGVFLGVRGKSCGIVLRTDMVRISGTGDHMRLHVQSVKISGPHTGPYSGQASVNVATRGVGLEFLSAPEEKDLGKLLSLITPSKDKYENDDDILVETLVRQRQKGSIIRCGVNSLSVDISDLESFDQFKALGAELTRLSSVTKYLPEDDRPGILSMIFVKDIGTHINVNDKLGVFSFNAHNTQLAHVGLPPLLALEVGKLSASRNDEEQLITEVSASHGFEPVPMFMARMISDEMDPTVKMKLYNICIEYRVPTIMAALGLTEEEISTEDLAASMASSIATVTGHSSPKALTRQSSSSSDYSDSSKRPLHLDILIRDCALGLNPRCLPSRGLFVFTDTHFSGALPDQKGLSATLEVRKASVLVIDNIQNFNSSEDVVPQRSRSSVTGSLQVRELCHRGYVSLSEINSAKIAVNISQGKEEESQFVDVEFKDDLFVLESCADSTQTLIGIINGLKPPIPPSKETKYRTNVLSMEEMMASFTGDAFERPEHTSLDQRLDMDQADIIEDELPANLEYVGSFYNPEAPPTSEEIADSMLEDDLSHLASPPITRPMGQRPLLESFQEQYEVDPENEPLNIDDDYFGAESEVKGNARKWNSSKNQYSLTNEYKVEGSPLKLRIRDVHVIWNLFDGYDWAQTRETIEHAVEEVERKADERRRARHTSMEEDDDQDEVVGDFLFGSVWVGVAPNLPTSELRRQINLEINDAVSETESYASSTASRSTVRASGSKRPKQRRLKIERSKRYKVRFELAGVSADIVVFPPNSGETQSSIDVRVRDFEVIDNMPTSTWKKFATYMHDAGERQMGRPMIHLEMLNVKPVMELAASEIVLRVTVLPLRLHVDQDALDFITRFFEFKDEHAEEPAVKAEQPFLQRVEVNTVQLKLDYKPKKVDYAGLRSGHTTEFMNFFILDGADITLRHCIIYGISGFDKLHKTLNDIWMPDVKRNQLPGVLAGLAPVRSLANVGGGVRDLVSIPIKEYQKDGRIVRSIQKGATAFARTTTSEIARLGAKVMIGTQTILQTAEGVLSPTHPNYSSSPAYSTSDDSGWEDVGAPEPSRAVSQYADQPIGVMAGFRGAIRSLERDLIVAKDAIVAVPGEIMESGSAGGAAGVLGRRAPTIILRPAIGLTKGVGMALMGAGNALDRESRRKIEDVSKPFCSWSSFSILDMFTDLLQKYKRY
ncbi:hypothetical protein M501DRAFT_933518, partial [Patellaria atrata CBS 101060]